MGIFDKKPKRLVYGKSKEEADEARANFFNNISGQSWNKAKKIKVAKKPGGIQAARMRRRKRI